MANYFAENFKTLRKKYNYTQEEIASQLQIAFQTVSKWERGETLPDVLLLPKISRIFNTSTDKLLGVNHIEDELCIKSHINKYQLEKRLGHYQKALEIITQALNEYPSDYNLRIRYMEAVILLKNISSEGAKSIAEEMQSNYNTIMQYCLDDSIRMWAKRLICTLYRKLEKHKEMYAIINQLPALVDSREHVKTLLTLPGEEHDTACKLEIEELLLYLMTAICHNNYYSAQYNLDEKIYAATTAQTLLDTVYSDGDYGRLFYPAVYNCGHLGEWHFLRGNKDDVTMSLHWFERCAILAKKYTDMPADTLHTSQLVKNLHYLKVENENASHEGSLKNRIYDGLINRYKLSDEFRQSEQFKRIVSIVAE